MRLRTIAMMILLGGCLSASAQEGFIIHLNALQAGRSGTGISVREVPDGYLVFCRQFSHDGSFRQHAFTRLLNASGTLLGEHEYSYGDARDYDIGYIDAVADDGNGSHLAIVNEGWNYGDTTFIYRFDEAGSRTYREPMLVYPALDSVTAVVRQSRKAMDDGFVLGGFWNRPGDTQAFLIRLSSDLDTLWTKRIGLVSQDEIILGLAEYTDGGFVLTGYRQATSIFNSSFLIRTDASGNPLWTRYYGGTAGQNGAVRVTSDGGIVTWSNYRESNWPSEYRQLMLTKWNAAGDIVWQRKSHYGFYSSSRDLEVLPDGSFIGTAYNAAAGMNGMLCKFSHQGDSLWTRGYQVASGPHYLNDITPTSDGGFVCTGEANRTMPIDAAFQQSQTIYVLKTDSVGCVVPGCQNVGVQEYVMDLNGHLRILPNPVRDVLRAELELPTGTQLQGAVRAVLLNAQGQQVHAWPMRRSNDQVVLKEDISAMQVGVYFLHIADAERWLAGGKVVVE
jgi:hypothetical protein